MDPIPQDPKPEISSGTHRRRLLPAVIGGFAALAAGLGLAWFMTAGDGAGGASPPASEGGLVIDTADADIGAIDPGKPLRCFVQGQFVGELTLMACAERNGVATDALDVGIDESGALAAADNAGEMITPLPPVEADPPVVVESALPQDEELNDVQGAAVYSSCWRYGGGRWRRTAADTDLDSCVQQLFAGRCERSGAASYGRFGQQTLRLVAGRVEVSDDNRNFRQLTPQAADCSIPPV
jgi:hypothetical protein